ncbi:MAG TPA: RpiB/LacA/LacB family sugar-phosphate isomerase [Anaerolineales bacterium]|nr:RpiB/LacA/LacB family sugar-phosphate isomerase [Anaerolineales bacterium]
MNIYLAADHRGFELKQFLIQKFPEFIDLGAFSYDKDDNDVDFAVRAAKDLKPEDRAVLLCGSGHGMDMAANKFSHVRGILGFNPDVVQMGRDHEDANVLILPAEWTTPEEAVERINLFMSTPFSQQEKYRRRLEKLSSLGTNH